MDCVVARRPRSAGTSATAAVVALLVEVYRLAARLGRLLALLVVTPFAFVAFKRWSFGSAERGAPEVPVR